MISKQKSKIQSITRGLQQLGIHKLNFPIFFLWGEGQTVKHSLENSFVGSQASWNPSWKKRNFCPHTPQILLLESYSAAVVPWILDLFFYIFGLLHNCRWLYDFFMLCVLLCYVLSVRQEKNVPDSSFLTDINDFWLTHSVQDFPSYQGFHIFMWLNFLFLLGILLIFIFLFSLFSK